ncbi:MAG: hypothetical protein ACXVA9_03045 [Bdellovibrionales bacterium]
MMLSLLVALLSTLSVNATVGSPPEPALPLQVALSGELNSNLREQLPGIFEAALTLVEMFPPKGYENNVFQWSADREILKGKNLSILFATKETPVIAPLLANSGAKEMDAFTMAPINPSEKTISIVVVLLVDEIFYDSSGNERHNGFSKLVLALAHEIYGNVQHFLEFDTEGVKPQTRADRIKQEMSAYRASLLFLDGLANNPKFTTVPLSTRQGILKLLPNEIRAYRSWLNAHPSEAPDPACEAMLKARK